MTLFNQNQTFPSYSNDLLY